MLDVAAWSKHLVNSGFVEVYAINYRKTGYIILEAKGLRKQEVNQETINTYAREELLEYMIPQKYCFTVNYPLTVNGKVDRKRILEWFGYNAKKSGKAITTDTEYKIAEILKELLNIEEIFADENFLKWVEIAFF